ncbi:hypothetical protein [Nitrosomonas supralitoralis]|uniref:hypothetical protein n=1 Tax=Nitrosomonas supralitoralis TaxID=2116706 RepID=UPI0011C48C10|nr:hypothetical protein [Nitrosomonas supralitoralis]
MLNEAGIVLRVGKASCGRTIGHRLGDYFRWGDKVLGKGVAKNDTFKDVRYIATIAVPKDRAFEAPAIEEFLLRRLESPLNSLGMSFHIRNSARVD